MTERRLKRGPYLLVWAALVAGQVWIASMLSPETVGPALAGIVLVQLLKVPGAAMRLADLGYPPDDALLALVPGANLGLWNRLTASTPSAALRDKRRAAWSDELLAVQALARGARSLLASAPTVAVLVVLFAGVFTLGDLAVPRLLLTVTELEPRNQDVLRQVLAVSTVLLLLYTGMQVVKRHTASRASWWPSFLVLPSALAWLLVNLRTGPVAVDRGPLDIVLADSVWALGWFCIGGAALAVVWVEVAVAERAGERLSLGRAFDAVTGRTLDVSAPHGAMVLIIQIGLQVIIPGIYYALQYAFVDPIAVLEPKAPALRRSTALTKGIRRRVFKLYLLGFLGTLVFGTLAAFVIEAALAGGPVGAAAGSAVNGAVIVVIGFPYQLAEFSEWTLFAMWMVGTVMWGCVRTGFVHMYWQRAAG